MIDPWSHWQIEKMISDRLDLIYESKKMKEDKTDYMEEIFKIKREEIKLFRSLKRTLQLYGIVAIVSLTTMAAIMYMFLDAARSY